ncbi:MAG: hypothetical protein AAB676_13445, partial [Verrucomicrobiota bacterium]
PTRRLPPRSGFVQNHWSAGGPRQWPMRTRWAARVAQFWRLCAEILMRRTLTILLALAAILFAFVLVAVWLPAVNKIEDLGGSGAGLELGEWQVTVGVCLLASVLFTVLALASSKTRFLTGLLIVSWLALLGFGAAAGCLYSIKGRTGIVNQYGHGLTYGEWWASVIPWTIATALVALSAVSSLIYALGRRDAPRGESHNKTVERTGAPRLDSDRHGET